MNREQKKKKCSGVKKVPKEISKCAEANTDAKAVNYFIMFYTAYRGGAEVINGRYVDVITSL